MRAKNTLNWWDHSGSDRNFSTKVKAEAFASDLRSRGYRARVTKDKMGGYLVQFSDFYPKSTITKTKQVLLTKDLESQKRKHRRLGIKDEGDWIFTVNKRGNIR